MYNDHDNDENDDYDIQSNDNATLMFFDSYRVYFASVHTYNT